MTTANHAMREAGSRCGRNITRTSTAISSAAPAARVKVVSVMRIGPRVPNQNRGRKDKE